MGDSVWKLAPPHEEAAGLAAALGIPLVIARVLTNRKITDPAAAEPFLYGGLENLHDPFLMDGMVAAADRIGLAVERREKILIFGDYDVDGILSMVMLHRALSSMGLPVDYFIPDRLKDGYGIKDEHFAVAVERGAGLVISVDCGIKAVNFIRLAKERGIDVIVTDHHRPGPDLPEALAVLDPALPGASYPYPGLAGVGVVLKLIQALLIRTGRTSLLRHYLKLASIGTIADVVELRGENRLIVKLGLRELDDVANPGLKSLIEVCGLAGKRISEGDVGFRIGPRINAAGRMGRTELAVRLFFSTSPAETRALARSLDELNAQRQKTEEDIFAQAVALVEAGALDRKHKILILGCEAWHRGIIGIVASRVKDAYNRPVILFALDDGKAVGSGRSISDFSLIDCLDKCREHFLSYGGHPYAVGCTLRRDELPAFKRAANAVAEAGISEDQLKRRIAIDAEVAFSEIDGPLLESHALLGPFGVGNPRPVFMARAAEITAAPRKLKDKHVKLLLRQEGRTLEALGWDRAAWADSLARGDRIDAAFTLQTSTYLGEERLYLSLEDVRR
jgi:single-stranded-DNA-specific exonuclease